MPKKMPINLLISAEMSEREEDQRVRLPRLTRESLGLPGTHIVLGKGEYQLEVQIRQAFRRDVLRLARMHRRGEISQVEFLATGFVTRSTYQRLAGRKSGDAVWISEKADDITIGCDPEFGLVNEAGFLQYGNSVLPGSRHARFGEDGPGVEVRPPPGRDHRELVRGIRTILLDPPPKARDFKWMGGATYRDPNRIYWFGGHIHLGRPSRLRKNQASAFSSLAKVLDHYLALPLLTFDTPEPNARRRGCTHKYGMAGQIRAKDGYSRFEYRVLSGLWLTHPTLARIVLGTAKAVAEDFYSRAAKTGFDPGYLKDGYAGAEGFRLENLRHVSSLINGAKAEELPEDLHRYWWGLLDSLRTREEYAAEVEALIALVGASPSQTVPSLGLRIDTNWGKNNPVLLPKGTANLRRALAAVEE